MKAKSAILFVCIFSLFLLGLDRAGILSGPRSLVGGALEPLQFGWYRLTQTIGDRTGTVLQIGKLGEDNLGLREENDSLKAKIGQLGLVEEENRLLRHQLGIPETKDYQLLSAPALGYIPAATAKELIIGEGSEGGVKVGQAVIVGKVILGKITGVQADRSTLRLLTDPASKVVAATSSGARGLLVGQFQSFSKLTKVLQEERLDVGELVFTAGEDDWPKGLVIGEVIKVIKKDNELFQEAEIKPQLNYDKLNTVFVILGKQ